MEKIKILMVMGSTNMGGTQMFILNLLNNMDLSNYQVDFVVNFEEKDGGISKELHSLGCEIFFLPYFRVYNYFGFARAWRDFLKNHRYDIVHGHSSNSASVYLRIAKKMGCKTIVHCHSTGFRGSWLNRLFKRIFTLGIKRVADYWFACSSIAAEHLFGNNYNEYKNYYCIPDAINAENYIYSKEISDRVRQKINVSDDCFLCGHVGSFTLPKNHTFLLDVFSEIVKLKPNSKLVCCGSGALLTSIKEKASELGIIDRIIFPGVVKNTNEYLMSMDVFVFPSIFEGFGIAILESEATGLPVVMSDVVPDEVILTDRVYKLSLSDSPKKWAEVICKIPKGNRESYNRVVINSKYNMKDCAKIVMSLYEEMVNKE